MSDSLLCECGHSESAHADLMPRVCRNWETVRTGKVQPCSCHGFTVDMPWVKPIENVGAKHDDVLSPHYYRRFPGGHEPRHLAGHLTFHLGTALCYIARAGFKGSAEEDINKAIVHLQFELERIKK